MQSDLQITNVPVINTWFRRKKTRGEVNTGDIPSLTQPDMALSMTDILNRFRRGQSIPRKTDAYYSDQDTSEFDKMDKFEKMEAAHYIREDIIKMQHELQNPPTPPKEENKDRESTSGQGVPSSDPKKKDDKSEAQRSKTSDD